MRAPTRSRAALLGGSIAILLLAGAATAAPSPSPVGEWLVANGKGIIRVVDCGGQFWGAVAWEDKPRGKDVNNPNPALRDKPTLGMPVLLGMSPAQGGGQVWHGQIYNSKDGRTYDGRISLHGPNTLRVEGCVLGFLCGGEDWTRVDGTSALASTVKGGRTSAISKEPPARVCSEVLRRH